MTSTIDELKQLLSSNEESTYFERKRASDERELKELAVQECTKLAQENKVLKSILTWKQKKKLNIPLL